MSPTAELTYQHHVSERYYRPIWCDLREGWRPEWWETLGGFPSESEIVTVGGLQGKGHNGCTNNHQCVSDWKTMGEMG